MRARYFDPQLGRFVSRDPEQRLDARSTNPNQGLFGNPLRFVDPTGLDGEHTDRVAKRYRPDLYRAPGGTCRDCGGLASHVDHCPQGIIEGQRESKESQVDRDARRRKLAEERTEWENTMNVVASVFLPIDRRCRDGGGHPTGRDDIRPGVWGLAAETDCRCMGWWGGEFASVPVVDALARGRHARQASGLLAGDMSASNSPSTIHTDRDLTGSSLPTSSRQSETDRDREKDTLTETGIEERVL